MKTYHRFQYLVILGLLLSIQALEAKRLSSSGSSRRTSKPSYSNSDVGRLSYSNYQSKPKPSTSGSSYGTGSSSYGTGSHSSSSHSSAAPAPIGWNVPKSQGPPPAYSASNPTGGAKTNIHEPAPAYRPAQTYNSAPPSYSASQNHGTGTSHASGTPYRPRTNSTGGFGGGYHTPITATNMQSSQSSYPRQQLPAGASYYPSGSQLPAGATYHSPGALPAGATYHPGGVPAGGSYYPAGGVGATYHSPGALPAGATYYPAGGVPHGASYYPAAPVAPAGATFLPAGAALPAGATYYSQPPKSSSGLGFGTGLLAGGLGGAILGHALTPTHTRTETVVAPGGYGGGGGGGHNSGEDRVIIINNGPPGSVTTTDTGHGTTVINTGVQAVAPASNVAAAPGAAPAPAPAGAPAEPAVPLAPIDGANPAAATSTGLLAAAPMPAPAPVAETPAPNAAPPADQAGAPPAGGIICMPVRVPEPDPADSTKTIEVEKIACYPAPPPQNTTEAGDTTTTTTLAGSSTPVQTGSTIPEGAVPLAPLSPSSQPDIMGKPGDALMTERLSAASLSEQSGLKVSNSGSSFNGLMLSMFITTLVSYCLQ